MNWSRLQIFHRCCTTWSISVFLLCKIDSGWGENSNRQWNNQRWQMLHLLGQAPSHTISTLKDVPGMEQFWNKTMQVVTNWNHNCGAFLKVPLSIFSLIMQLHPLEGDQQKLKHQKSWTVGFNLILAEFTRPSRSRQGNFLYFCTPLSVSESFSPRLKKLGMLLAQADSMSFIPQRLLRLMFCDCL